MQAPNGMTVTKDPKIWMEDGSIVLRARSQEGQHCFKCHRSILASCFLIFADLFSVPQTNQSAEKFEGIDVVDLPDAHEDVRNLLCFIYDSGWLAYSKSKRLDDEYFIAIGGVLRLSDKYEITTIRAIMITLFESAWPTNFKEWDERQKWADDTDSENIDGSEIEPWIMHYYPEPALAISIAEEFGIPLTAMQLTRFLAGKGMLQAAITRFTISHPRVAVQGSVQRLVEKNYHLSRGTPDVDDLLQWMGKIARDIRGRSRKGLQPCLECRDWAARLVEDKRASLWGELPRFFQLV